MVCRAVPVSDPASARARRTPASLRALPIPISAVDFFLVWKLDRLGRDRKHLVSMVDELRGRGAEPAAPTLGWPRKQ